MRPRDLVLIWSGGSSVVLNLALLLGARPIVVFYASIIGIFLAIISDLLEFRRGLWRSLGSFVGAIVTYFIWTLLT